MNSSVVRFSTAPTAVEWDYTNNPAPRFHTAISLWATRLHKLYPLAFFVKRSAPTEPSEWHRWSVGCLWETVIPRVEASLGRANTSDELMAIMAMLSDALALSLDESLLLLRPSQRSRLVQLLSHPGAEGFPTKMWDMQLATALVSLLTILSPSDRAAVVAKIPRGRLLSGARFNPHALVNLGEPAQFLRALVEQVSSHTNEHLMAAGHLMFIVSLFKKTKHGPSMAEIYLDYFKSLGSTLAVETCERILRDNQSSEPLVAPGKSYVASWCLPAISPR